MKKIIVVLVLSFFFVSFTPAGQAVETETIYEAVPFEDWEACIEQYADRYIGKSTAAGGVFTKFTQ